MTITIDATDYVIKDRKFDVFLASKRMNFKGRGAEKTKRLTSRLSWPERESREQSSVTKW